GTYLLVHLGFNRLAKARATLARRVAELETLVRSARALGRSLDEHEQAEAVCRETLQAMPGADRVALELIGADGRLERHVLLGRRGVVERERAGRVEAAEVKQLRLGCDGAVRDPARPAVRAELTVPLTRYGEVLGALRVEARAAGALGA